MSEKAPSPSRAEKNIKENPQEAAKKIAAEMAAKLVENGMKVGLGTGSTANYFIRALGRRVRHEKLDIICAATSRRSEALGRDEEIEVVSLNQLVQLDLTVDGADEFDQQLQLIKGGGGALLREKIVANASKRMVVIADDSKEVMWLGQFALPVEIIPFGAKATRTALEALLARLGYGNTQITERLQKDQLYVTDQGNHILDLSLGRIQDPRALSQALSSLPGIVDHGLFIGMADQAIIGYADGRVDHRERPSTG